jgi:GT2 family glycosyltransferase
MSLFENSERIGAVGPKMLFPDGRLQEAGAYIYENGASLQVGLTEPYHPEEVLTARPVDYCSAACLAVRRQLFDVMGGFDPLFTPAYYEDADLCLRMTLLGFHVYYCPSSTVIHIGGETSRTVWDLDRMNRIIEANRARFLRRWGSWLRLRALGDDVQVSEDYLVRTSELAHQSSRPLT